MISTRETKQIRRRLLDWYATHRRDLPWRHTKDPYRVWVSEVMLQQTQVTTVIPYYQRFIGRFPTLEALARADIEEVLPLWSGLGYYRRVRHLHAACRIVVERHGGRVPKDRAILLKLPGVGRYTAGAILSIAFGHPEPVLDGNVTRVLCRILALEQDPTRAAGARTLWKLAAGLVPADAPSDFNQALMELGATVCVARKPQCGACPLARLCRGHLDGIAAELPRRGPRARVQRCSLAMVLLQRRGRLLIVRRDHPSLMTGLWEFPMIELVGGQSFRPAEVRKRFDTELGLKINGLEEIGAVHHAITTRRIILHVCRGALSPNSAPPKTNSHDARWIRPAEIVRFGVSSLSLKALRLYGRETWSSHAT